MESNPLLGWTKELGLNSDSEVVIESEELLVCLIQKLISSIFSANAKLSTESNAKFDLLSKPTKLKNH